MRLRIVWLAKPCFVVLWLATSCGLHATTIVPFSNLAELAQYSDAVVLARMVSDYQFSIDDQTMYRLQLQVLDQVKGDLDPGQHFELQKWEMMVGNMVRKMFGDIDLQRGGTYLLFLVRIENDLFHPLCFSYYIFEEQNVSGTSYLSPSSQEKEFILVDDRQSEPLFIYKKKELISHLKEVVNGQADWNHDGLLAEIEIAKHPEIKKRNAPSHCTFLSSGSNFRWTDFPTTTLPIHYQASGDGVCASIPNFVADAVSTLNQNYQGINLVNGGGFSGFNPSCGSAYGSSFRDYVMNTYGDNRRVLIQFNDPCNELPALQNCGGTLAVGGLYGIGSHMHQGENWFSGAYGYVVVNDGVGQCHCSSQEYRDLIVHELSHSLGLGHIGSSSGMANMNPVCCNSIQLLDMACMDYSYEGIFLPVSLTSFTGSTELYGNDLLWETASEQDVDAFIVERNLDETIEEFVEVGRVTAVGNSETANHYLLTDHDPNANSYYRLKIQDLDGTVQFSEIVQLDRPALTETKVFPSSFSSEFFIHLPFDKHSNHASITVADISGKVWITQSLSRQLNQIRAEALFDGIYFVTIVSENSVETFKIQKS